MQNNVIAEVSIIPIGTGSTGLSKYVACCLDVLGKRQDVKFQLTPMGTVIEGRLDSVLEVISIMHEAPFSKGASRVVTTIKIDDRRDKAATMSGKVNSVLKSLSDKGKGQD